MDKPEELAIAATMGIGTVQAFTTFVGSVATVDMVDEQSYWRGVGMALGWSFLISSGFAWWSNDPAPIIAWLIISGAMLGAYEYHRDKVEGGS
jgi:hypothetical protein